MDLNKILNMLFFPGIVLHETSHALACLLLNVPIKKIKFIGKEGGYVVHDDSKSYKIIIISITPFFLNIFFSLVFARVVLLESSFYLKVFFTWLALSSIYFCLPSAEDVKNVFSVIRRTYFKKQNILLFLFKIALLPVTLSIIILVFLFRVVDRSIVIRLFLLFLWIFVFLI